MTVKETPERKGLVSSPKEQTEGAAMKEVKRGLEESARGETEYLGSFAGYADHGDAWSDLSKAAAVEAWASWSEQSEPESDWQSFWAGWKARAGVSDVS